LERVGSAGRRMKRWGWRHPSTTLDSINAFRHGRSAWNLTRLSEILPPIDFARRYDVIHCHFGPNGQLALAWRDFGALQGPILTTFHGYDANQLPRVDGPNLYRRLFGKGELFTVGSEFMKRRLVKLGAPENRLVTLPMGVDLSRFRFVGSRKNPNEEIRLLTVARLIEGKGVEYAIRAIALLKEKYSRLRYQIVGDGPLREKLVELTNTLHINGHVIFLGALPQESITEVYRDAQIFVLPSVQAESGWEEGQGVVLAEAQATGLPIIATRTGGIPESIRDGVSGVLVAPRDPAALAAAIEQLASQPDKWSEMGSAGRAYVEENFDIEWLNDRLVSLYRRIAR
jgi:colanic acid/amylovoran biosynthesis glycosyltransferase